MITRMNIRNNEIHALAGLPGGSLVGPQHRDQLTGALLTRVRGWVWGIGHKGFSKGAMKTFRKRLELLRQGQGDLVRRMGLPGFYRRGKNCRASRRLPLPVGAISAEELRRVASRKGWVIWRTSGIMERVVVGRRDGKICAHGPYTPFHPLRERPYYFCRPWVPPRVPWT